MKKNIFPFLTLIIFLFCFLQENLAQEAIQMDQNTFEFKAATKHQKISNNHSKTVEPATIQKPVFKKLNPSQEVRPLGIQAKSKVHPSQTVEYWNTYIGNAEKQLVELQQNDPNNTTLKQKIEGALERAKIRKALISQ